MRIVKRSLFVCLLVMFSACLSACNSSSLTCKNGHGVNKTWHTDSTFHYVVCDKCGDVIKHDHNYDWKVESEARNTLSEVKVEYCTDCGYLTGKVESLDTWNGVDITKTDVLKNRILTSSYRDSKGRAFNSVSVNTGADLVAVLNEIDDHKNFAITLTGDIDMSAGEFESAYINGYDCGDVEIIIDGNYHKLIGIKNSLIGRISSGNTKVIIRNLTIENANIVSGESAGVLISTAKGVGNISIDNCEIKNSSIIGNSCIGGFVGVVGGNSGLYSKIFSEIEIKNSTITNSSIGGNGKVGAIIGNASDDAWTKLTIKNCGIINNRITSTSSHSDYAGIVVGVAGVAGTTKTVSGTTYTGGVYLYNIVENENSVISYTTYINRMYGSRGEASAQLYIDNVKQF